MKTASNTLIGQHPESVEFDYPYTEKCPNCAAAGSPDVSLGFAMSHGGIVCATGEHRYDTLPGSGATTQPETASASPDANQSSAEVKITGVAFETRGGVGKVPSGTTASELKARMQNVLQEQMREKARKLPTAVKVPTELPEPVRPRVLEQRLGTGKPVEVLNPKPAPGGDLEITVRLREPHVQAVVAEAANQNQTVPEFLANFFDHCLENWVK